MSISIQKEKEEQEEEKSPKTQTEPPTVPVASIFTSHVYPEGETHEYRDE